MGKSEKNQFSNISRIMENVEDFNFQYFQDRTEYGSYDPIFPGYEEIEKLRFPIFPGFWRMMQTSLSDISRGGIINS